MYVIIINNIGQEKIAYVNVTARPEKKLVFSKITAHTPPAIEIKSTYIKKVEAITLKFLMKFINKFIFSGTILKNKENEFLVL
ncbi:MAG TPA: hypothetical protein VLB84_18395 [Bacteroidia bacterium]|nr:hypothetical protein [Bacteroidia bacterium]